MNKQKVFDKVVNHLLTQNMAAIDSDNVCVYRGNYNTMCAVGCLIKDEHYRVELEGLGAYEAEVQLALSLSGTEIDTENEEKFLVCLQKIHDNVEVEDWSWTLMFLAKVEGLKFNYKG